MAKSAVEHSLEMLGKSAQLGIHASLENVVELASELGNPHTKWVPIHVAGTNGKTSTSRLIDVLLRSHGQKVGLSTSPHLVALNERIIIDGEEIDSDSFGEALSLTVDAAERRFAGLEVEKADQGNPVQLPITEFEYLTAASFLAFAQKEVDFGVVEAGIGGRWDATCVLEPAVSVVTSVGLDHTDLLGDTLEEIARDKAHIIKPGCTAIVGDGLDGLYDIFSERATKVGANLRAVREAGSESPVIEELTTRYVVHDVAVQPNLSIFTCLEVTTSLGNYGVMTIPAPSYQAKNIATAITAAEAALGRRLDGETVRNCLEKFQYPGRFEIISSSPLVVFDGAHNPQAMQQLADIVKQADIRPVIALGGFKDKDFTDMIRILDSVADAYIALAAPSPRALGPRDLIALLKTSSRVQVLGDCASPSVEALSELADGRPVIVTGSLSLYSLLKSNVDYDRV